FGSICDGSQTMLGAGGHGMPGQTGLHCCLYFVTSASKFDLSPLLIVITQQTPCAVPRHCSDLHVGQHVWSFACSLLICWSSELQSLPQSVHPHWPLMHFGLPQKHEGGVPVHPPVVPSEVCPSEPPPPSPIGPTTEPPHATTKAKQSAFRIRKLCHISPSNRQV